MTQNAGGGENKLTKCMNEFNDREIASEVLCREDG